MRIFLFPWPIDKEEYVEAISDLQNAGHEIVYWVSVFGELDKLRPKFPNTIFHDHLEAGFCKPAIGLESVWEPPPADLIKQLYKVESLILTMMNKRFDWMCVDERKHLYYQFLGYWSQILKKYQPDFIIFPGVPHTVYDYLVYELAKLWNIKTLIFENTVVTDRLLFIADFRKGSEALQMALLKNKNQKFTLNDLEQDLQEYYYMQTDADCDATPPYLKDNRRYFRLDKVLKRKILDGLRDFSIFRKTLRYIFKKLFRNIQKEYKKIQKKPDWTKKFVYFPLHFQPESAISPHGDIFADQILAIETLSAALPEDWVVFVKEHPVQWFHFGVNFTSSKYRNYYKKIAEIPNVNVVPIETDTYQLINKSQAVATITGTAIWEAFFREKPAMFFGYPWYQDCPCIFRVNDIESCRLALTQIIQGYKPSKQEVINFLKSLEEATVQGYFEEYGKRGSKLSLKESTQNFVRIILEEIQNLRYNS